MALRFIDSFDHYPTASVTTKWTASTGGGVTISSGNGRNGTSSARGTNIVLQKTLDNQATWYLGAAIRFGSFAGATDILAVMDGTTRQVQLGVISTGELRLYRGNSQLTTIATSSGLGLQTGVWYFIELKVVVDGTAGQYEVRVNGAPIAALTATGANTRATTNNYANVAIGGAPGSNSDIDDFYVCDGTGSANNNFLGDRRVITLLPDGAGNYTQWTPSAGSNFQCVDEASMNSDTDYVSSSTAAQKDTYNFGAVGIAGTVAGIQVNGAIRKDDAGSRTVRRIVRVGATDYNGANVSVLDSYAYSIAEVLQTNPATSAAWTVSDINSIEVGVELVS